jgi:hypothetical protein
MYTLITLMTVTSFEVPNLHLISVAWRHRHKAGIYALARRQSRHNRLSAGRFYRGDEDGQLKVNRCLQAK